MPEHKRLYFGVAGWDYPDWEDTVYRLPAGPAGRDLFGNPFPSAARRVSDRLEFLAQYVDMVEINSTFYRTPTVQAARAWAERVASRPGFFFTAKLSQEFTHQFRRDPEAAGRFREAMAPLQERNCLRALLAQFRYDFDDRPESRQLIRWLRGQFAGGAPVVIEVRHRSWESPEALAFFRDQALSVAHLDYPTGRDSFSPRRFATTEVGYLRLHGRNREAWFAKHVKPHEPYNYDYPDQEIAELADRATGLLGEVKELTIVANNHYRGKAVSAALRLKSALTQEPVEVPPALLETYPGLARITTPSAAP